MVSIIILSYNTKQLLHECLTSLFDSLSDVQLEVIVVDNFSRDDSVRMVSANFPKVKIVENKENLGFAGGCNKGAEVAKGEYLLFLNSDTVMTKDALTPMTAILDTKENIGVVGGRLVNTDGTSQFSYNKFYTLPILFVTLFLNRNETIVKKPQKEGEVDWITGACMLVRKKVFDEVGGLDTRYFMYIEDMEFCFRVRNKGYGAYFIPTAKVMHIGQGSSSRSFAIVNIYRGILLFYKTHKSHSEYVIVKMMLIIKAWLSIVIGHLTGNRSLVSTYREALHF